MRLSTMALIGLAACGVATPGRADPPKTVVDPWSANPKASGTVEVIDPWKTDKRPLVAVELVDPWKRPASVPTATFPVPTPVIPPIVTDPWAHSPRKGVRDSSVPTARFPLVEVIDPWKPR